MENVNNSVDHLEDEILSSPTGVPSMGQFLDETFQNKLNERANQISNASAWATTDPRGDLVESNSSKSSLSFLLTKPLLVYSYSDLGDLLKELSQWFVVSDYDAMGAEQLKTMQTVKVTLQSPVTEVDLSSQSVFIDSLTYFVLGEFNDAQTESDQFAKIEENCKSLITQKCLLDVVDLLARALEICAESHKTQALSNGIFATNYFKLMTIIYFAINSALASKDLPESLRLKLSEVDLLTKLVKLSDIWKLQPCSSARLRNCLLLLWKLILLEFGDTTHLKRVDDFLVHKYKIKNKERKSGNSKRLTCSRLEYFTFEEDLHDKYPLKNSDECFDSLESNLNSLADGEEALLQVPENSEMERQIFLAKTTSSNSLSNLIEFPTTNKVHSVFGSMPVQTVHIATPVPSPPKTPSEFMTGGEKVRKSYHVNQGMPFIYPSESEIKIPDAIDEASTLFQKGIYESYSSKRLLREREVFAASERGYSRDTNKSQEEEGFESDLLNEHFSTYEKEITSLLRVESFYSKSMHHLRGFVEVMINIIASSKINKSLRDFEVELDPETSFTHRFGTDTTTEEKIHRMIYHDLDMLRAKEIVLKAVSAIMILMLRWFKKSHVLKYYYLSTLLFDSQFHGVFIDFLADSFDNSALQNSHAENKSLQLFDVLSSQNRLMNPAISIGHYDFFSRCRGQKFTIAKVGLVNKIPISKLPHDIDKSNSSVVKISHFNEDFCFILVNLFNSLNKILLKNHSQRVIMFNELKPTDLMKVVLLNYINDELQTPILKIFKKITPFQGRKWRALNMDVVSLIFLHLKLSLKDNWLSGRDLESDLNTSFDQEVSLRSLLQFYNMRNYTTEMRYLGYSMQSH